MSLIKNAFFKNSIFKLKSAIKYNLKQTRSNSNRIHDNPLKEVRVRFAPSPTGKLHIGGLRTAFYNYLFARKYNGKFLLRIEDTDQDRLQANSLENIIESLSWANVLPDYGPHKLSYDDLEQGAPWIQSQRLDIYAKYCKMLLDSKKAYRCFCDEGRLQLLKRNSQKQQKKINYDGKCGHLSDEIVETNLKEGKSFVVRFKLIDKEVIYNDMTTGLHKSNIFKNEGDFIIMKSDNYPTYHFANVVDDHLMRITHVLRGQEWQVSTAKHILIYEAFGWTPPEFLHLPLLCNNDSSKISKRQNDIELLSYRDRGYLKETILSYLTTLGGGSKVNLFEQDSFFKTSRNVLNELVEQFDETKISAKSVKLNPELLDNINRRFIQLKINSNYLEEQTELIETLRGLLLKKYNSNLNELYIKDEYLKNVLKWFQNRITRLNELIDDNKFSFLWTDLSSRTQLENMPTKHLKSIIENLISICNRKDLNFEHSDQLKKEIDFILNKFKEERSNEKSVNYWHLVRFVLTGSTQGPPVIEIFQILGKENLINRLTMAKDLMD